MPLSRQQSVASRDLDRFRYALQRLNDRLQQAVRPDRFKPPEDLTLARVSFTDRQGSPLVGEIIDIGADGMKIALAGGETVAVGETCELQVGADDAEHYELSGSVRWVQSHPYITVFGVLLDSAELVETPPG